MVTIREAIIDDFDILLERETHINDQVLKKKIEHKEIIVILENNTIIGWLRYSLFWDEHPFINMLFIQKEYRKKGYGKKLVSFWEQAMKQKGYTILMTSTLSNEESQNFYRNMGYKDRGGFVLPQEPLEIIFIKEGI
ncbi:GNAT family N-acetyltransferase [Candidatus Gracilibacteria bacterium]|nr:MAG: GNAT family N-acetyltransferase [Candidatus Gracilibacteria bacterium]